MGRKKIHTIILLLLFISACNAPRTNPLDPKNPDNIIFTIEGNVKTVSLPRTPLSNVKVFWKEGNKVISTASDGSFSIETHSKKNGWIIFSKDGYSTDSVLVRWGNSKKKILNIFLNALPQLLSNKFSSIVLQRYPNIQNYYLDVTVQINDNENDIDSVFFENTSLKIHHHLNYNITEALWERKFSLTELNLVTLDELIGKTISYTAKDKNGKLFNIGKTNLKRIIRKEIQFVSPANNQTVTQPVTLRWRKYQPGFNFHFKIEIYKNSLPKELVLTTDNIKHNTVSFKLEENLSADTYFWIIYCIDEFGNQGSSRPASFKIE